MHNAVKKHVVDPSLLRSGAPAFIFLFLGFEEHRESKSSKTGYTFSWILLVNLQDFIKSLCRLEIQGSSIRGCKTSVSGTNEILETRPYFIHKVAASFFMSAVSYRVGLNIHRFVLLPYFIPLYGTDRLSVHLLHGAIVNHGVGTQNT